MFGIVAFQVYPRIIANNQINPSMINGSILMSEKAGLLSSEEAMPISAYAGPINNKPNRTGDNGQ